jgi:hypothetical protein
LNATLHGEDNKADVIQEYFNDLNALICGEMNAALIVTHHIRKGDVATLDEMKAAVRGSSALTASVRCVLGFWQPADWEKQMKALKLTPERNSLFKFGVLKCNNDELLKGEKTMARGKGGAFIDVTKDVKSAPETGSEAEAWLVFAVGRAAKDNHAFSKTSLTNGLFARREEMPPILQHLGRDAFKVMADRALRRGSIVSAGLAKSPSVKVLDLPDGPAANAEGGQDPGKWHVDWDDFEYNAATQMVLERSAFAADKPIEGAAR